MSSWAGLESELASAVAEQTARCLATYREDPLRVEQDAAIETSTAQGGYGRKQLYELIQNGADALLGDVGRIHVVLTRDCLYVANEGRPMTAAGVSSLMASHISRKRGDEIGRFGLGFKSVVAISRRPQIISRSGSFGFDQELARERIKNVVQDSPGYPMLRIAESLDSGRLAEEDSTLRDLMSWATTIVRIPLVAGHEHLKADVEDFPAEFLLFSPQVSQLTLEDRDEGVARVVTLKPSGQGALDLDDNGSTSTWRVATRKHRPSAAALADAGDLAHREAISVSWAVPLTGRTGLGAFWAFFPTEDQTTLSGIVNAPWKMGDDRRNLLPGRFNQELLVEVLPALMAAEWAHLTVGDDPAAALDVFPARGKEARSWADGVLNVPVFDAVSRVPCLPDAEGRLRPPAAIRLHPKALLGDLKAEGVDLLRSWASLKPVPSGWIHWSVEKTAERRLKAERLIGDRESGRASVQEWIEAICTKEGGVAASATAIGLVDRIAQSASPISQEVRRTRAVLLENEDFAAAVPGHIFVRSSPEDDDFKFIHPELATLPSALAALKRLGIQVLDRAGELRNLLSGRRPDTIEWAKAWMLARQCTTTVALGVFRDELPSPLESSVRVRNRSGRFVLIGAAYLPGGIVSEAEQTDSDFCIDTGYHRVELELLTEIGCVAQPTLRHDPPMERWLLDYRLALKQRFVSTASGAKPHADRLVVADVPVPWPLQPLGQLSPRGRLTLTRVALGLTTGAPVTVRHQSVASYGTRKYMNPVHWAVMNDGRLSTQFGPLPPDYCLRQADGRPADVLPVTDVDNDIASALRIKSEPQELAQDAWAYLVKVASSWPDARRTFRFYARAVHFAPAPSRIRAQVGRRVADEEPRDVAVVSSEELFHALIEQNIPVLYVEDDADAQQLRERWELENGAQLLEQELVFQEAGEAEVLVDLFPKLRLFLKPEQFAVELQTCETLDLVTATRDGTKAKSAPHAFHAGRVLVTATKPDQVLAAVSEVLQLDLTREDIQSIIENVREQETEQLLAQLRNAPSDEARLALLVGSEKLRRALPASAIEAIEDEQGRPMTDLEMAALVRSVHGVSALQNFKTVLEERHLNPPQAWAGGSKAKRFVTDIGFAPELAGFASMPRPATFAVDGPAELLPLHDYQEFVTKRIRELVDGSGGRGMVSLPTGAGKTRVAVQALVDAIRDGGLDGPVVWIAQSDELCEQAVESWAYIWRAIGAGHQLTIGRLWGSNDVVEATEGFQLVVATPDKLDKKIDKSDYDWLADPTVVVVDEAHTSVAPSYTRVLEWLGRGRSRKGSRVLLGLTATPFRNTNQTETERLAARYDRNRLDVGAFAGDAYTELQKRGVLATVNHRLLEGASVDFSPADRDSMDKMRTIPSNVLNKLAGDAERNRRIVDSVASLPDDWTSLLFATSVENASALAALLSHRGIPSVAISGTTDSAARRHYIEEFKRGRIRVITNYNVLTQGFDAPAVRAVYVTRPTFSANVYQQMIGRGLRGPLNGGSEEVLIVNVEDNFQQFGDQLAFLEFEHLWNPDLAVEGD